MADIAGAIFGSGESSTQTQRPDWVAQAANVHKVNQLNMLFDSMGPMAQFGAANYGGAYTPTPQAQSLMDWAMSPMDQGNMMTLDEYQSLGLDRGTQSFYDRLGEVQGTAGQASSANAQAANTAIQGVLGNQAIARGNVGSDFNAARTVGREAYNTARGDVSGATDRALAVGDRALGTGLNLGLNELDNYIARVATPQIMQQMTLQGLEGGTAVGDAIARATGEAGLPLIQSLMGSYLPGQISTAQQQAQIEGSLAGGLLSGEQALGGQYLGAQSELGQQGLNSILALLGQYQQAQAGIGEGTLGAVSALGQGYGNNLMNFIGSLPGAATQLSILPAQDRLAKAQAASTLFPIADYSRGLTEQDVLRRQGLFQTAFTGIPFTPGGAGKQSTSSQPLFNFFGQG